MYSKYTKRSTPERMWGSVFASYIWGFNPKLTIFSKYSPQNRSFYQIKHRMHSYDITILLEKLYFTTSNNFAKNLCVASVSSYSTSSLKIRKKAKMAKNVNLRVIYPYLGCQNEPFNTFGMDVFTYLKHIGVQIKEKITGKTASGFFFFGKIQGRKSQLMNLALWLPRLFYGKK